MLEESSRPTRNQPKSSLMEFETDYYKALKFQNKKPIEIVYGRTSLGITSIKASKYNIKTKNLGIYRVEEGPIKKIKVKGIENAEIFGVMLMGLEKQEEEMKKRFLAKKYDDETNAQTTQAYKIDKSMYRDAIAQLLPVFAEPKDVISFFYRAVRFLNLFPREHKKQDILDYLLANNDIRASIKLATEPSKKKSINHKEIF